ncbi:hypothetical protein P7C73_g1750, partial [Tremellales sp. Uapishka_1]
MRRESQSPSPDPLEAPVPLPVPTLANLFALASPPPAAAVTSSRPLLSAQELNVEREKSLGRLHSAWQTIIARYQDVRLEEDDEIDIDNQTIYKNRGRLEQSEAKHFGPDSPDDESDSEDDEDDDVELEGWEEVVEPAAETSKWTQADDDDLAEFLRAEAARKGEYVPANVGRRGGNGKGKGRDTSPDVLALNGLGEGESSSTSLAVLSSIAYRDPPPHVLPSVPNPMPTLPVASSSTSSSSYTAAQSQPAYAYHDLPTSNNLLSAPKYWPYYPPPQTHTSTPNPAYKNDLTLFSNTSPLVNPPAQDARDSEPNRLKGKQRMAAERIFIPYQPHGQKSQLPTLAPAPQDLVQVQATGESTKRKFVHYQAPGKKPRVVLPEPPPKVSKRMKALEPLLQPLHLDPRQAAEVSRRRSISSQPSGSQLPYFALKPPHLDERANISFIPYRPPGTQILAAERRHVNRPEADVKPAKAIRRGPDMRPYFPKVQWPNAAASRPLTCKACFYAGGGRAKKAALCKGRGKSTGCRFEWGLPFPWVGEQITPPRSPSPAASTGKRRRTPLTPPPSSPVGTSGIAVSTLGCSS